MKYIIDIPEGIHKKVLQLVADGEYGTMQDFVLTALQNQLLIEDASSNDDKSGPIRLAGLSAKRSDEAKWNLSAITPEAIASVSNPIHHPQTDWLFGQVNRILPIKFGLRILLALLQNSGDRLVLDRFLEKATNEARSFGKFLEQKDEAAGRRRDDRISVGFPTGQLSKSLQRYRSLFLGYLQPSTGRPVGALVELNFADIFEEHGGSYSIGVTKNGLQFGLIPNPIMDNAAETETMSEDEAIYYVKHVCEYAPGEANTLRVVMSMIFDGLNRPDEMDAEMGRIFPDWSSSYRSTNRSGAIGRATDLGLLEKVRLGSSVQYRLSDLGSQMLGLLKVQKV